jgi:hydrogenase maturation factor
MQAGKLPLELLSRLLGRIEIKDPRVALGARAGEDAALIDFGDRFLVTKTDPITFATDLIGWYLVQVNSNDLAVMGATPKWLMVTLLLPEGIAAETVSDIFDQLLRACDDGGITLIGGHTEVTYDLPRPIAIGCMLGEVEKSRVVLTSGARPGDALILTQGIAVEGTSLLAREAAPALLDAGVPAETIERARNLLFEPGISVRRAARIACDTANVHSMHDPTEGGLASGLLEMAQGADAGMRIELDAIAVLPECRSICAALGLDPLGLIASGSLLAAVAPEDAQRVLDALRAEGISATQIGHITHKGEGCKLVVDGMPQDMPRFARDEIARYFGG